MFKKSLILVGFTFPVSVNAALMVDQNNPNPYLVGAAGYCYMSPSCGQSFRQTGDNIAGIGILMNPNYGSSSYQRDITITVYDSWFGSQPYGLVATGTAEGVHNTDGWVDIFWDAVDITAGTTYYFTVTGATDFALYHDAGLANGQYLNGGILSNSPNVSSYDTVFRTYTSTVPIPAAAWLFGSALVGLGVIKRKRS